ncbi:MAG: homoserine kinase [Anaerolineae bacterium]
MASASTSSGALRSRRTVCAEWAISQRNVPIDGDSGKLSTILKKYRERGGASVLRLLGEARGVNLTIHKGLPLASGLGSSAASAVARAMAVNALLNAPLSKGDLLPACLDGEEMVSGRHADNVAPCLFGGITLVYGTDASQVVQLPIPANLYLALVTPAVEVPTRKAREALPPTVSLRTMVAQTAGVARLVDSIHRGDLEAMAAAMESDGVIEPARQSLMPLLAEIRATAKAAGALGAISGAGPTLCAVCAGEAVAQKGDGGDARRLRAGGDSCQSRWTQVASEGARTL